MKPEKPYLFVGSSSEARDDGIVHEFISALSHVAHCIPWYSDKAFSTNGSISTFEALCYAAHGYDFAIFILTNDDIVHSRKTKHNAPRDNVLFELGLFLAAIGPSRVLAFSEEGVSLKVPSDLSGINLPRFACDRVAMEKTAAGVSAATVGVTTTIKQLGFRKIDLQIAQTWGWERDARSFSVELSAAKLDRARPVIGDWSLCLAGRILDEDVNFEQDKNVVYTTPRPLPPIINQNFSIRLRETDFVGAKIGAGTTIESRILLTPPGRTPPVAGVTLETAIKARCRDVERASFTIGRATAST